MTENPVIDSFIEAIIHPSVLHSPSGEIVAANTKAADLLGLTVETLLGRESLDPRWRALNSEGHDLPGPEHPAMIAIARKALVGPLIMGVEMPNGERRWISVTATPVKWRDQANRFGCLASFSLVQQPHGLQQQDSVFIKQATHSTLFQLLSRELEKLRSALQSAKNSFARRDVEGAEVAANIANSSIMNIAKWRDLYTVTSSILHLNSENNIKSTLSELNSKSGIFIDFAGFEDEKLDVAYIGVLFLYRILCVIFDGEVCFTARVRSSDSMTDRIECFSDVRYAQLKRFFGGEVYDILQDNAVTDFKQLCFKELISVISDLHGITFNFLDEDGSVRVIISLR